MDFVFHSDNGENRHRCHARREGDWAVFTCPQCEGYERKIHLKTGQMITQIGQSDPYLMHEGFFLPVGLENAQSMAN